MRPEGLTDKWRQGIRRQDIRLRAQAKVYGGPGKPLLGVYPLAASGGMGTITHDATQSIRHQLSNAIILPQGVDPDGAPIPIDTTYDLFPSGNEVVIEKGQVYDDGTVDMACQGRFVLESTNIVDSLTTPGDLQLQISGSDHSCLFTKHGNIRTYTSYHVPPKTLDAVIYQYLTSLVDGLQYVFEPDPSLPGFPVPNWAQATTSDDPWQWAMNVAAGVGFELYVDQSEIGVIRMRPMPDPSDQPVTELYDDEQINVMTVMQRELANTDVPNVVVCTGQSAANGAIQGIWWDPNPLSDTFYGVSGPPTAPTGTYPTTTKQIQSSSATTTADCTRAAKAAGIATLGKFESLDARIVANPAHEVEDVIKVHHPRAEAQHVGYVLDAISVQLNLSMGDEIRGRRVYWQPQ